MGVFLRIVLILAIGYYPVSINREDFIEFSGKMAKNHDFWNIMKDFEKTKRGEAMKWYF